MVIIKEVKSVDGSSRILKLRSKDLNDVKIDMLCIRLEIRGGKTPSIPRRRASVCKLLSNPTQPNLT